MIHLDFIILVCYYLFSESRANYYTKKEVQPMEDNKLDFERLTAQQIYNYMNVNATDEQKKDFKKTAFPTRIQKTSKKLFTADGQPIMYQVKDKSGNPKLKDGKPVMRQKVEMVEVADGEKKPTFSLLAAKWWFAENFSDAVKNVPVRASKKETPASKLFENW